MCKCVKFITIFSIKVECRYVISSRLAIPLLYVTTKQYAIPKIKMLCSLHCLKARLRLLGNKYQRHSSLNLVSQQLKLCNIFIFGMVYYSVTNSVQLLLFWSSFLLKNPLYGNLNVESTSPINFHFGFTYQSFQNLEQTLQRQQFIIS